MPRKKKLAWEPVTPLKKFGLPDKLPIYIDGFIDVPCLFCKGESQRYSKLHLFFCIHEEVIENLKSGFILSCEYCEYREYEE